MRNVQFTVHSTVITYVETYDCSAGLVHFFEPVTSSKKIAVLSVVVKIRYISVNILTSLYVCFDLLRR